MTTKHTQGEWIVTQEPFNLLVTHQVNGKTESICQISQRHKTEEEQQANAKLIAAATDLLEALQCLIDLNLKQNGNVNTPTILNAKAAIKKATE